MKKLRPCSLHVYDGIKAHWQEEKRSPSLRELQARLDLTLTPIRHHLEILEKAGLIAPRRRGVSRDIYLAEPLGKAA